jgi:hypothetical protein
MDASPILLLDESLAQKAPQCPASSGVPQQTGSVDVSSPCLGCFAGLDMKEELHDEPGASFNRRFSIQSVEKARHTWRTGCVGWPSMMDCSHSIAGERMVGQTGGFSYTAPAKKNISSVKILKSVFTRPRTLPEIRTREFFGQASAYVAAHHDGSGKFSPPM